MAYVRLTPAPTQQVSKTELPAAQSVTAANTAMAAHNDTPRPDQNQRNLVLIDPATREIIYRVTDVRTGMVVRQVPEASILRARAYAHAIASGKSATEALFMTNLVA
jgi:hypothetical protein